MIEILKRGSNAPHGDEWGVATEAGTVWFKWFHAAADYRDALRFDRGAATLAVLAKRGLVV